jgi:phage tail-like protein
MPARAEPFVNSYFRVEIDGVEVVGFHEVHLPELTTVLVEYRDGSDPDAASRNLPGRSHFGPARFRRGFRGTLELYEWWKQAANGEGGRRPVVVQLLDESRRVVFEWLLRDAWPTRYFFSPLLGEGSDVFYEHAEVACESIELRGPGA